MKKEVCCLKVEDLNFLGLDILKFKIIWIDMFMSYMYERN